MSAGRYCAILLAAGAGTRFGGSKLTAPWDGGVLLAAALRSACAAPVMRVIVVTGAHADAVESAVSALAPTLATEIETLRCADHATGMSASLRCGLAGLPSDVDGTFIFLGDMPHVPTALPALLLARVRAGALAAAPAARGRLGHPVLISRALFEAFAGGAGDGEGRRLLEGLGGDLATVEADADCVLADVDTQADLERLRAT